jgi:sulfur-carrier protein adenylyltransferase/sulfurtransferase
MMQQFKRYQRQIELSEIGSLGQEKLQNAKVLIIGAGGLGCPVLQILAAAGVGTIGIVDGDQVDESNLHRQLLYTLEDSGKNKAEIAALALSKINPEVLVYTYPVFISEYNIAEISQNYEILVDCTDNIAARYLINDISLHYKIPMVYASIHKFEGQISVFNYHDGPSYRCLFQEKEGQDIPNCVTTGVLGVLPNTLGHLQATEVLKIILGIGSIASGKLLIFNALNLSLQEIVFSKNEHQINLGIKNGMKLASSSASNLEIDKTTFWELSNLEKYTIIDLREPHETPHLPIDSLVKIRYASIGDHFQTFNKDQPIILVCQSGIRSKKALQLFIENGFNNVVHLQKGIQSLHLDLI